RSSNPKSDRLAVGTRDGRQAHLQERDGEPYGDQSISAGSAPQQPGWQHHTGHYRAWSTCGWTSNPIRTRLIHCTTHLLEKPGQSKGPAFTVPDIMRHLAASHGATKIPPRYMTRHMGYGA